MLILSEHDLHMLLPFQEVIRCIEDAFHGMAQGEARVPNRIHLDMPEAGAVLLDMPAQMRGALGTKIVSVFARNAERGLPLVQSVYLLLDADTGTPLALMDGRYLTAIRTAATSAVATKHMASAGAKRLAIFGAGVQAWFHIQAMAEVANIERVWITSRSTGKARLLVAQASALLGVNCATVPSQKAVAESNLICTCTTSGEPLFDGSEIIPGTHINAVGAFTPTTRELDNVAVRRSRVIIDDSSAAGKEAGEIAIPLDEGVINADHIKATLAQVVSGQALGRASADEITLFKSTGLAIEDLVTAQLAYERAMVEGIGIKVSL